MLKYVLVIGAAGGMGQATAKLLRDSGFTVFALDRNLINMESGIVPMKADITDMHSLESALSEIRQHTDRLYAIVHLAGMYALDSLLEIDEALFKRVFEVNVFGVYRVNKVFTPLLEPGGRIVITTSELAALDPLPFTGLYAVTKSTLDKYAYSLRMEMQLLDIHISVLRPGAVKTNMLGASTDALEAFCSNTTLYPCNAKRFRQIVERVESRNVSPERVAVQVNKILRTRKPRYVYHLNRNPLLLLFNILPHRIQTWIIGKILK